MLAHSGIFQKGLLLVGIPVVTQLLFIGALVKIRADEDATQELALHHGRVIAESERLYIRLLDVQSLLRGLLITDDPSFAAQYREARGRLTRQLDALSAAVAADADQAPLIGRVHEQVGPLLTWQDGILRLLEAEQRPQAIAEVKTLRGHERLTQLRRTLDAFLTQEEAVYGQRRAALDRQARLQNGVLIAGALIALGTSGVLAAVFARSIAGRLRVLTENARRLAAGEELLAPLAGDDELGRLDRSFREMAEALAQKHRENEMFVYSVSHDLRSPLVNLQGFSQELRHSCAALREGLTAPDVPEAVRQRGLRVIDADVDEAIHFIQTAVTRLAGIIDALLRLSRVGRVEYHRQAVDMGATVRRVVTALRGTLTEKGAEVAVAELPPAWSDPTAVEQVFANLIGNAVNYLDPGRPGRIEVGARPEIENGLRVFYVKDNGLGIPEAHQGKVFVAFQRLHPEAAQGEGIGLALVRRVVERHQGRLWLESEAGRGSTFYVALPADAPRAA